MLPGYQARRAQTSGRDGHALGLPEAGAGGRVGLESESQVLLPLGDLGQRM